MRFKLKASNNESEYEALIAGLSLAKSLRVGRLLLHSDSRLVVNQVLRVYEARDERMDTYMKRVRTNLEVFEEVKMKRVPWQDNSQADALARLASATRTNIRRTIPVEILPQLTIEEEEVSNPCLNLNLGDSWMDPLIRYIREGVLPDSKLERRKLRYRAAKFLIVGDVLYRKGFLLPLLRFVHPTEVPHVLREVHEGSCSSQIGGRPLDKRILTQGYW